MGYTKVCNHSKPSTVTHNHPQLFTIDHNAPQPSTTIHNHPHPPKNYPKTQRFVTNSDVTLNALKMLILKQSLTFDSDTKQWYIYMYVCVSVYILYKSL